MVFSVWDSIEPKLSPTESGYYPITAVHRNLDPELTFLWVKSNSGAKELIETTPEHPFYLAQNVDGSPRPAPQGHEELNRNWVGAGHLKIGDKLRLASGELGEVTALNTVQQSREMYNLTVSQAHTYYVGQNGWLVHNVGYKSLCGTIKAFGGPDQAHHLNQNAAYRSVIPQSEGESVPLLGNAFTGKGTPHYNAHASMESFWEQYRTGSLAGTLPTNRQYEIALARSLQEAGLSPSEIKQAVIAARNQRLSYGLGQNDPVPNLPGRINQKK